MGVAGEKFAMGYFGYAYYAENMATLTAVKVDGGVGPIEPTPETISSGTYAPLSRPLMIYVTTKALARPEVKAFVDFILNEAETLVPTVKYVPLPKAAYELAAGHVKENKTGSRLQGNIIGVTIEEILKRDAN
jgi:phosphate transport system substrate-binding protein